MGATSSRPVRGRAGARFGDIWGTRQDLCEPPVEEVPIIRKRPWRPLVGWVPWIVCKHCKIVVADIVRKVMRLQMASAKYNPVACRRMAVRLYLAHASAARRSAITPESMHPHQEFRKGFCWCLAGVHPPVTHYRNNPYQLASERQYTCV